MSQHIVTSPEEITPDWLSAVLGVEVSETSVAPVGTGQIGAAYRAQVPDPLSSVLIKLPAPDPAARTMLEGAYRGEIRFYSEIAETVAIRVPRTYYAQMEPEGTAFTLVMADLAPGAQGDQLAGCTDEQAADAVVNLAGLHGPRWCDPTLLDIEGLSLNGPDDAAMMKEFFAPAVDIFVDALGARLDQQAIDVIQQTAEVIDRWALGRSERYGLVHGDYRLDNLIFPPNNASGVHAVDWQTLSLALPARDLAFFAATSLHPEQRRRIEGELVRDYHDALLKYGVADYPFELCFEDYRFAMLQAPLVTVFGCAYGTRTERGDEMFAAMIGRAAHAIADLDAFSLIP